MKERPILFSGEMVRAILDGRKTQTRRLKGLEIFNEEPFWVFEKCELSSNPKIGLQAYFRQDDTNHLFGAKCPYGSVGDRLIVAREIPSIGRNYCAGTDGVIYSRARGEWRPLKAHGNGNGYPSVTVMIGSRKTTRTIHSLVCEAFYGPSPFNGAQVRHLDGNAGNNKPSNLAWGTQAENWRDRKYHGNGIEGEKHHAAKLSDTERQHVRWAIERGLCSQRHVARTLGMAQSSISQLMEGSELLKVEQDIPSNRIPCITLEIVSVRVERLQDISEEDAKAEGIEFQTGGLVEKEYRIYTANKWWDENPFQSFKSLWQSINGPESWEANPWVWVIEFKKLEESK